MIRQIQMDAQRNVAKQFSDNGVRMMTIQDIWERQDDGTVIFHNPDNPSRPFETRDQAQRWIESINNQISSEFQKQVYQEQQKLYSMAKPAMDLLSFAPVFDMMDDAVKDVFDSLIEPYSITNAQGKVIGFDCNLPMMAQQAQSIVNKFGGNTAQKQQEPVSAPKQQQPKGPAMDIKTGAGESPRNNEVTNLQEAWIAVNAMKKEK